MNVQPGVREVEGEGEVEDEGKEAQVQKCGERLVRDQTAVEDGSDGGTRSMGWQGGRVRGAEGVAEGAGSDSIHENTGRLKLWREAERDDRVRKWKERI